MHIQTRQDRESLEATSLAPYAGRSATTRGRRHPESRNSRRVEFQRDRDRVINSKSFRRLEYKTQVFINGTADHYRTRLTHTMEMSTVSRTLARALRANEDLTDAIALAHDIGHPPFGHCGERALNELMRNHGGFDHNLQSLRCVEYLEAEYPEFDGLNLTWEVRAGLRKHESQIPGVMLNGHPIGPFQMIEGQIADVADDITYQSHDVQDGLEAGLLTVEALQTTELWRLAEARVDRDHPNCPPDRRVQAATRCLITLQIEDVLAFASARLDEYAPQSPEDVMNAPGRIVAFGDTMHAMLRPYRDFLFKNMYWHPSVTRANDEAVQLMTRLFRHYVAHPGDMGRKARARLEREGLMRTACDYVAGCTDRYALEEVHRFGLG